MFAIFRPSVALSAEADSSTRLGYNDRTAFPAAPRPSQGQFMSSTPREHSSPEQRLNESIGKPAEQPAPGPDEPTLTFQERDVLSSKAVVRYFGDYELLQEVARGGMGVVFKARQVKLNRIVAVKMILGGSLAGPEGVQRFHTEAEAAARLDHPGIVPVYEVGQHEGQHYFSMGYVEGLSLSRKVEHGPLPPREAAEIVKAVAEAVQYAHEKGIIHRDLKPGNILLNQQGSPKVTDFGLAKLAERGSDLTGSGQIVGTPSYMPPEQAAAQVTKVGKLSDIYSLGAILYCLLTGRPPFQAATPLETLLQVQRQEPIPPQQLNASIPLDLDTIVLKCLNKSPARRYASAVALAEELGRYLDGRPIQARPVGRAERFWRWCKREPVVAGLSTAVAITLITGVAIASYYAHSEIKAKAKAQENLRLAVVTAVDSVQSNRGPAVASTLSILASLPHDLVRTELKSRYAAADSNRRLGLAYGLSEFGEVDAAFLCSQIKQSDADEVDNFVAALRHDQQGSLRALHALGARSHSAGDWRLKARLATVALHLGDETIAADMCQTVDRPDPVQRTIFTDEFPAWHGDLTSLLRTHAEFADPALRSALCMAVDSVAADRLAADDRAAWKPVLCRWFESAPDNDTHSAAGWALRQWDVDLPALTPSAQPTENRSWFVNTLNMTMLNIQPGQFIRQDPKLQTIRLTRPFFLCDREVTIGQFRQFVNDPRCPSEDKPANWNDRGAGEDVGYPQALVNWYQSVLFCNWLSRKEGLAPSYERTGRKETFRGLNKPDDVAEFDEWRLLLNQTGYRLPTEAEWEFACRTGTTTGYSAGNDFELLRRYAVFATGDTQRGAPVASKMPNAWGLFDMHGNLGEWCHDWYWPYAEGDLSDPFGPAEMPLIQRRVTRGGAWLQVASLSQSARRDAELPGRGSALIGFRVARSPAY